MDITCTIDEYTVTVKPGTTILDAAESAGISIPTLCHMKGYPPFTSCMVCVVLDRTSNELVPACTARVRQGMVIDTVSETVFRARREALNMLLSEHAGDCKAPCTRTCPAHPETPRIIRFIKQGNLGEAHRVIRDMNPFPGITGHICPAPCEKSCTRKNIDFPVSIKLLEKYIGNINPGEKIKNVSTENTGKKVAVVGAGPAGLASAYYILLKGHSCTIFEKESESGGNLRQAMEEGRLPREVMDNEIESLKNLGAQVKTNIILGADVSLEELRSSFDAVILALGTLSVGTTIVPGSILHDNSISVNRETFETDITGVFACGGCVRHMSMAIKAIAQGRAAARGVHEFLTQKPLLPGQEFDSIIKIHTPPELKELMKGASPDQRIDPVRGDVEGFTQNEAEKESARCLHCDCYKPDTCSLRKYAAEYNADQRRYSLKDRKLIERNIDHPFVVREMSKCIKCGGCVRLTEKLGVGMSFMERGYTTTVDMPFHLPLDLIPDEIVKRCVLLCPTGALAFKEDYNET
ncbi:MAG: (2Fe-2S)-binding protein [Spirochaetales bacterium]|nr:(2Fe-2S)-binding protein [Spirochaetales bacterium]